MRLEKLRRSLLLWGKAVLFDPLHPMTLKITFMTHSLHLLLPNLNIASLFTMNTWKPRIQYAPHKQNQKKRTTNRHATSSLVLINVARAVKLPQISYLSTLKIWFHRRGSSTKIHFKQNIFINPTNNTIQLSTQTKIDFTTPKSNPPWIFIA